MYARIRTLREVYDQFCLALTGLYDEREAKSITYRVLEETLGYSKSKIHASWTDIFPASISEQMDFILHELLQGKPLQYVFGKADFLGLILKVKEGVLIPRPETEELVAWILEECRIRSLTTPQVLDIGTGSGCIAISLAKFLEKAKVQAWDVSEQALAIAADNAKLNQVNVDFLQMDVLLNASIVPVSLDVVVSNPPYVCFSEREKMHRNVLEFEPHLALFVPDNQALIFYERIADIALQALKPQGMLFFEINEAYGKETVAMLEKKGFSTVELRKDLFDKDRMVMALL